MTSPNLENIQVDNLFSCDPCIKEEEYLSSCEENEIRLSEGIGHHNIENCRAVHPFTARVSSTNDENWVDSPDAGDETTRPNKTPGANLLKSTKPTKQYIKDMDVGSNDLTVNPVTLSTKTILAKKKKIATAQENEYTILNSEMKSKHRSSSASPTAFKIASPRTVRKNSPPPAWMKKIPVAILDLDDLDKPVLPLNSRPKSKERAGRSQKSLKSQQPGSYKKQFYKIPIGKASQELPIGSKRNSTHTAFITVPRPSNLRVTNFSSDTQPIITPVQSTKDEDPNIETEHTKNTKTETSAPDKKSRTENTSSPTKDESSESPKRRKKKKKKKNNDNTPGSSSSQHSDVSVASSKPESTLFYGGTETHVDKKKQSYKIPIQVTETSKEKANTHTAILSLTKPIYKVAKSKPTVERPSTPGFHVQSAKRPKTNANKKISSQTNVTETKDASRAEEEEEEEEEDDDEEEELDAEKGHSESINTVEGASQNKDNEETKNSDPVIWLSRPQPKSQKNQSKVPLSFSVMSPGKPRKEPTKHTETKVEETTQASTFQKLKSSMNPSTLLNIMFAGDEKNRILSSNKTPEKLSDNSNTLKPPKGPARRKSPYQLKSPVESRNSSKTKYKLPAKEFTNLKTTSRKKSPPKPIPASPTEGLRNMMKHLHDRARSKSQPTSMNSKENQLTESLSGRGDQSLANESNIAKIVKKRGVFSAVIKDNGRSKDWTPRRHRGNKTSGLGDNESQDKDSQHFGDIDAEINNIYGKNVLGVVDNKAPKSTGEHKMRSGRDSAPLHTTQSYSYKRNLYNGLRRSAPTSPVMWNQASPKGSLKQQIGGNTVSGPSFPRKPDQTNPASWANSTFQSSFPKTWKTLIQEKYQRKTTPTSRSSVRYANWSPKSTYPKFMSRNMALKKSISPESSNQTLSPTTPSGSAFGRISPKTILSVNVTPDKNKETSLNFACVNEVVAEECSFEGNLDVPFFKGETNLINTDSYPFSDSDGKTNLKHACKKPSIKFNIKTLGLAWNCEPTRVNDTSLSYFHTFQAQSKTFGNETDDGVSQDTTASTSFGHTTLDSCSDCWTSTINDTDDNSGNTDA